MNGERSHGRGWALLAAALLLGALGGWLLLSGDSPTDETPEPEGGPRVGRAPDAPPEADPEEEPGEAASPDAGPVAKPCPPERLAGRWQSISVVTAKGEMKEGDENVRLARIEFDLTNGVLIVDGLYRIPIGVLADGTLNIDSFEGKSLTVRPTLEGDLLVLTTVDGRFEDDEPLPRRIVLRRVEETVGEAGPAGRTMRYYRDVFRLHFADHRGGRVGFPIDRKLGRRLREKLPPGLESPLEFLTAHLHVLDREEDYQIRQLARIALTTHAAAVELLLERRGWRELSPRGKQEVAALLSIPGATTVERLAAAIGDPADPVVFTALVVHTRHTYGCPSWHLVEGGSPIPVEVAAHWRRWLVEEWPARAKLTPRGRVKAEVVELRKLFDSEDALAEAECADRTSLLTGGRHAPRPRHEAVDRDRLRKRLKRLEDTPDFWTGREVHYATGQ